MEDTAATGRGQSDLSIDYSLHKEGSFSVKDAQVFVSEFLGTFFLALIIGATKVTDSDVVGLAIGFGLVAIIYTFAPVSGGQVNPAVSLCLLIRNKLSAFETVYCIISQLLGAVFAGLITFALYDNDWSDVGHPLVNGGYSKSQAFVAEMVQTFALATVALNTATTKAQGNNSYYGIAIGFVVLSGAIVQSSKSGSCYNPAVAMLTLLTGDFDDFWVFVLAPLMGGVLAGLMFRFLNPLEIDGKDPLRYVSLLVFFPDLVAFQESWVPSFVADLLMEFIGTFFLCMTIAMTANVSDGDGYIAIGTILTSMVYAGGAVSGGHYNPAVSVGVYLRRYVFMPTEETDGMFQLLKTAVYIVVQIIGGYCGGGTAAYLLGGTDRIASPAVNTGAHTLFAGFVVEYLFAMFLVLAVLNTATLSKVHGNSYFGTAIGFVVLAGIATVADISGGAFNPAVGISLPSISDNKTSDIWIYVFAPVFGAVTSAGLFVFFGMESNDPTTALKNALSDKNVNNDKKTEISAAKTELCEEDDENMKKGLKHSMVK